MTNLENQTIEAIRANTEDDWGATICMIVEATGQTTKVLRGVISSLIQKGAIEIQHGDDSKPDLYIATN
jgi:hypothetical protein